MDELAELAELAIFAYPVPGVHVPFYLLTEPTVTMSVDSLVLVVCVMLAVMLFLDATHCCEQQKTR